MPCSPTPLPSQPHGEIGSLNPCTAMYIPSAVKVATSNPIKPCCGYHAVCSFRPFQVLLHRRTFRLVIVRIIVYYAAQHRLSTSRDEVESAAEEARNAGDMSTGDVEEHGGISPCRPGGQ
eukprot:28258-Eustigmatos_ZCMA.PRE.1